MYFRRACSHQSLKCSRALSDSSPKILLKMGELLGPATISPCTFTMDHDEIVYFMTDGLARGPDKDVHVPSVGSPKYPSRSVDVIYL